MATNSSSASGNYWAVFGTQATTNTLFAQVKVSGTIESVNLGAIAVRPPQLPDPAGLRRHPVLGRWRGADDHQPHHPQRNTAGDRQVGLQRCAQPPLQVDSVGMTSYALSGTFTSSVFDAGSNVAWGIAAWTANVPAGTTLTVETSSSTDGVNWSAWSTVTNGGLVSSPSGRYLRYQVLFTTTNAAVPSREGRPAGSIELRVSPSPSKIPYGGFSPVRLQMDRQWRPSTTSRGLSAVHIRPMRPSYTPPQLQLPGIRDPRRDYPFENLSVQCGTTPNN